MTTGDTGQEPLGPTLAVNSAEFERAFRFVRKIIPRGDKDDKLRYVALKAQPGSGVVQLSATNLLTTLSAQISATIIGEGPFQVAMCERPLRILRLAGPEAYISVGSDAVSIRMRRTAGDVIRCSTRLYTTDQEEFAVDNARYLPRARIDVSHLRRAYRLLGHIAGDPFARRRYSNSILVEVQGVQARISAYDGCRFGLYIAPLVEKAPVPWSVALAPKDFGWCRFLQGVVALGDAFIQEDGDARTTKVSNRRAFIADAQRSARVPSNDAYQRASSTRWDVLTNGWTGELTEAIVETAALQRVLHPLVRLLSETFAHPVTLTIDDEHSRLVLKGTGDSYWAMAQTMHAEHEVSAQCKKNATVILDGNYLKEALRGFPKNAKLRVRIKEVQDSSGETVKILRVDEGRKQDAANAAGATFILAAMKTPERKGQGQP
jgi:hypothetical protein